MDLKNKTVAELKSMIRQRHTTIKSYYRIAPFLTEAQTKRLEKYAEEAIEFEAEINRRKELQRGQTN